MLQKKVFIPEVVEPDESLPLDLLFLRRFAMVMDQAVGVPGTRLRVGIDAALNLFPGIGTVAGAILSTWIVLGGVRHRVPALRIVQMMANIILDLFIGWIPFVGEVFKIVFRENVTNLRILMRYRDRTRAPRRPGQMVLAGALVIFAILLACFVLLVGMFIGIIWLFQHWSMGR